MLKPLGITLVGAAIYGLVSLIASPIVSIFVVGIVGAISLGIGNLPRASKDLTSSIPSPQSPARLELTVTNVEPLLVGSIGRFRKPNSQDWTSDGRG